VLHKNTVFYDLVKHIPWSRFEAIVESHGADERARGLKTKAHFLAMLYGQLSESESLRAIVEGLESHEARLYHIGSRPVKRSTLADANRYRKHSVFSELLTVMMAQAHRKLRREVLEAIYLID
jgi:hypothetical protein